MERKFGERPTHMATKQKDSVAGKEKHMRRLQPSTTPSGTSAAKDHGKAPTGELKKIVPNYLKPTVSSKPDVAGKHLDTSHNKPNLITVRRRSLDRPASPSHVRKAPQSSSRARGERNAAAAAAAPLKSSSVTVTRNAASSERVLMVVKAVKAQPPLVKVKTLPKVSNVRKEVKSKASGSKEEEEEEPVNAAESEGEDEESLDLNVEEELAKMESHHVYLPHLCEEEDVNEEEDESPKQHVDADEEKLISDDITVSEVEAIKDETQDDQESNQLPDEDADIEEMKTTPDEQVAEKEDQEELHSSSDDKPEAESVVVVHKRQVGSKKEYNDVIEETASKLVEKRANKVRALAGAFETVISLQHPHSS
ncbi:hypothetical protein QQ045_004117 [Rhodiola kirilowii]